MARAKKSDILSDFYRDSEPDAMRLAELVNRARGKRSVTEFANLCGVSPSTISRLERARNNTPSSDDLIVAIAINADKNSRVSFQDLVNAHGMHFIREEYYDSDAIAERYKEVFERIVNEIELEGIKDQRCTIQKSNSCTSEVERRVRAIISNAIMEFGYSVAIDLALSGRRVNPYDFVLKTNALEGEGLDSWGFEVKTFRTLVPKSYFDRLFAHAYLSKPRQNGRRITVVFTEYESFREAMWMLKGIRIDDSISLMYVDMEQECVAAEYLLKTNGDVNTVKLFDKEGNNNV